MTITLDSLLELIASSPCPVKSAGKVAYYRRSPGSQAGPALREFLAAMDDQWRNGRDGRTTLPAHPGDSAMRHRYRRDSEAGLTAAELVWLRRLPTDPVSVPFDDASRLAALHGAISAMQAPDSHMLIAALWEPVRAVHDERIAQARLEQAKRPLPWLPTGATNAAAELLGARHPGLSEDTLLHEADRLVKAALAERDATQKAKVAGCEQELRRLRDEKASRTETTRETI